MLKKIITLSILVIGNLVIAQSKLYLNYDWERSPVNTAVEEKYKKFDYFTLKNKHILEYAYDSNNELSLFETVHVKTHINTDKGVEAKNKMYISTARIIEMIDLRARCITAAGKVINLDKSNIKEIDNLENQGKAINYYSYIKGLRISDIKPIEFECDNLHCEDGFVETPYGHVYGNAKCSVCEDKRDAK